MPEDYTMEDFKYLHQTLREAWTKYVYFLLAVAASAIAFSVSVTSDEPLQLSQIPLGIAVSFWGLSFYFGCRSVWHRNESLGVSAIGIMAHLERQLSPGANRKLRKSADLKDKIAARYMRWQFGYLVAGAVSFILWHVLEMATRTP